MIAQNTLSRYPASVPKTTRLSALQALLRKQKLAALLVSDPHNVRYLTGLKATEALVLVAQTSATLIVDGRYIEVARTLRSKGLKVAPRTDTEKIFERVRRCGFEADHVTVGRLRRWKRLLKSIKFIQTSGLTEGLRRKKDTIEIKALQRALSITDAVIRLIPRLLVPGVTEKHLANRILAEMLARGADGTAFESIVAFGKNTSLPHHRAGKTKLRRRDLVQIDIGAVYDGYCADRSEVFFIGEPTMVQRKAYRTVRDALRLSIKLSKAGAKCGDVDARVREFIRARGFDEYPHALGHGVGMDVHEGVVLAGRSKETLIAGDVIALEPGIYVPGKFGIRLEDMVFVK